MSAAEIANELERFQSDISTFEEALKVIESNYKNMFSEIKALDAMWTGQAHDAFAVQFGQDAENMEEVLNYVKELLQDLQFAHKEYTSCERSVNDIVNSMRV